MVIYVAAHKKVSIDLPENYEIIQVGANLNLHFAEVTDDVGDNISFKNKNFCELTAQYWIWKNAAEKNIVGLCHYRRFFYSWPQFILKSFFGIKTKMLRNDDFNRIFDKYDAIVTTPCMLFSKTVWQGYEQAHYIEDLVFAKKVIMEKYPEYMHAFNIVMNRHKYHYGNMLVCKKDLYDKYSKWLFDILFEIEKHTDLASRSNYQQRAYGFLSERLMDVFLLHNNVKCKEQPVVDVETPLLIVQLIDYIKLVVHEAYTGTRR